MWSDLFESKSLVDMWEIFIAKLQEIIDTYVPKKNVIESNIVHGWIIKREKK